jgi:WD40 repeat protein
VICLTTSYLSQISFHPAAPRIVFVTSRRSNQIRAYDLQYVGSRKSFLHRPAGLSLLGTFDRSTTEGKESQQKFGFHIDWAGRYIVAGDAAGVVKVWNIAQPSVDEAEEQEIDDFFGKILRTGEETERPSISHFQAADDAIASVMLHPTLSLLAVASGARHWEKDCDDNTSQEYYTRDGSLRLIATVSSD